MFFPLAPKLVISELWSWIYFSKDTNIEPLSTIPHYWNSAGTPSSGNMFTTFSIPYHGCQCSGAARNQPGRAAGDMTLTLINWFSTPAGWRFEYRHCTYIALILVIIVPKWWQNVVEYTCVTLLRHLNKTAENDAYLYDACQTFFSSSKTTHSMIFFFAVACSHMQIFYF